MREKMKAKDAAEITVKGSKLIKADHVAFLRMEKEEVIVEVDSGKYEFRSTRRIE